MSAHDETYERKTSWLVQVVLLHLVLLDNINLVALPYHPPLILIERQYNEPTPLPRSRRFL